MSENVINWWMFEDGRKRKKTLEKDRKWKKIIESVGKR